MASCHVAFLQLLMVNPLGAVVDKNDPKTTYKDVMITRTEPRVIAASDNPSSIGNPDIATYIKAEAAAGYVVTHIDQTMIISYASSDI